MSEAFTFDDVDPNAQNEFDEIPAGTYLALIEECVSGAAKTGTPELRVQFRVQTGDFKNRVISDWLYFTSATQQMIAQKIIATGAKPPTGIKTADQAPARVSGIIHGRYVQIVVRPDTYQGETRSKVKAWKLAPDAPQPAGVAAGNGSSTSVGDDDIPF
jgi:hypothetical protein